MSINDKKWVVLICFTMAIVSLALIVSVISKNYTGDGDKNNEDTENHNLLFHDQPEPLIPPELQNYGIGQGKPLRWTKGKRGLGLNIYYNPKLTNNGYILDDGESVCVGDKIVLIDDIFYGEWFGKGGPQDSPPIEFYSDLDELKTNLDNIEFDTYETPLCSAKRREFCTKCLVNANIFCSTTCNDQQEEFDAESGESEITFDCDIECTMYIEPWKPSNKRGSLSYGCGRNKVTPQEFQPTFADLKFTDKHFNHFSFSIRYLGVFNTDGPQLEIDSYSYNKGENLLYIELKNTGDIKALIDDIHFDQDFQLIYSPSEIDAGEKGEILVKTLSEDVIMTVGYRAAELGCLNKKDFEHVFTFGDATIPKSCIDNADCLVDEMCCAGYCRGRDEGICDDIDRDGVPDTWIPSEKLI